MHESCSHLPEKTAREGRFFPGDSRGEQNSSQGVLHCEVVSVQALEIFKQPVWSAIDEIPDLDGGVGVANLRVLSPKLEPAFAG